MICFVKRNNTVKYGMFTDRQTRVYMAVKTFKTEDYITCVWLPHFSFLLSLSSPTPKNGETYSNNLSPVDNELFECA